MPTPRHVAILGGGISGLTTAFYMSKYLPKTSRITVIEKSARVGGWIRSFPVPNSRIALESGPRTFKATGIQPAVVQLIHDLNLTNHLVTSPITSPAGHLRYLYLEEFGRLALLPAAPLLLPFSPEFRWLVKDLLFEFFAKRNRPEDIEDESIDSLVSRRFSPEAARVLVSSMIHGIFAADSRQLSVGAAFPILTSAEKHGNGSILRGLPQAFVERQKRSQLAAMAMSAAGPLPDPSATLAKLSGAAAFTFEGGMEMVPRTLEARLSETNTVNIRTGVECSILDRPADGDFELSLSDGSKLSASHVVSTLPWTTLHSIISESHAYKTTPLPQLLKNPSSNVQVLNLVFPPTPKPLHPPAFGFLIPRPTTDYPSSAMTNDVNGDPILQNVLGTVFDSCVDPKHDHTSQPTIMTLMMGGPMPLYTSPGVPAPGDTLSSFSSTLPPEELAVVLRTLARFLGRDEPLPLPLVHALHTHYNAIPTYLPGALNNSRELRYTVRHGAWGPNLDIIGMGNSGVSLGDAISSARMVAVKNSGR